MVAASRIDLPHTNALGAHRRRGARRSAIARVRRDRMTLSPRARPPDCPVSRPAFAAMQTVALAQWYGSRGGPINSGLWVTMTIIETCGFHATPLEGSLDGTVAGCASAIPSDNSWCQRRPPERRRDDGI